MAKRKIYSVNTTAGKRYGVGLFEGKTMMKSSHHGTYKTRKGAKKKLRDLNK